MSYNKILIIEDEPKVAQFIKKGLEENSFKADIAYNGANGLELIKKENYDALILDLNLPDLSGYVVCETIRKDRQTLPVLMLTAMGATEDKLIGFESGADDYLVKPFEFRELLARIRALLKRSHTYKVTENIIKVADLELNSEAKTVKRNNKLIDLSLREFNLLELLMRNSGKVISRAEIADKIWEINFDSGTNVIDVYINFLRKKVDKNFSKKLIHTQIGMGYVLKDPD